MLHYPKRLGQGFPVQCLGQLAGGINQSDAPAPYQDQAGRGRSGAYGE